MWSDTKWYGSDMCKVFLVLNVTPETTHANFRLKIFVPFILEARVCGNCAKKNNMKANKLCKSGLVVGEWLPKKKLCFLYMTRHSRSIACHARSSSLLLQQLFVHNLYFFGWKGNRFVTVAGGVFFFWKVFLYIRWSTFHDRPCRKVSFKFCIVDKRG